MTVAPAWYGRREPFPVIDVSGSAHDMGVQHGRLAQGLIDASVRLYRERFERENGLSWGRVLELAGRAREAIAAYDPEAMAEIEGIAEGSGYPLHAIVALNTRTELLAYAHQVDPAEVPDECTSAAVLTSATADGHVLLGRNWDQTLACLDNTLVVRARPSHTPALIYLTEAGILIREGVNEAGIGVTGNLLVCDRDGRAVEGMPVGVVRRRVLRHGTLDEAVQEVLDAPCGHSVNHLIADAAGAAIDLETVPGDVFRVGPEDGVLVHSNHFRDPRAASTVTDTAPTRSPSSLYRDARVREHLAARHGAIGVADLQAAFRDHHGFPDSVCNHPREGTGKPPTGSVASTVMDLTERAMWIAPHPVCENPYTRYALT
jgi:isopenicillin-N N-acyltransferase like protein